MPEGRRQSFRESKRPGLANLSLFKPHRSFLFRSFPQPSFHSFSYSSMVLHLEYKLYKPACCFSRLMRRVRELLRLGHPRTCPRDASKKVNLASPSLLNAGELRGTKTYLFIFSRLLSLFWNLQRKEERRLYPFFFSLCPFSASSSSRARACGSTCCIARSEPFSRRQRCQTV